MGSILDGWHYALPMCDKIPGHAQWLLEAKQHDVCFTAQTYGLMFFSQDCTPRVLNI